MNKYETFAIFYDNLSPIYIFTIFATVFTIICTLFFTRYLSSKSNNENKEIEESSEGESNDINDSDDNNESELSKGLLGQLKSAKFREIEESLTEEQIAEEKIIEQEQLAAIYFLLKEQESLYNTGEIDETDLKEQLKLYR